MPALRTSKVIASPSAHASHTASAIAPLSASATADALEISFSLSSKRGRTGGGVLAVSRSDLGIIVQEAVAAWPDIAPALAETIAAALASALEAQRRFQGSIAARVLRHLEHVDDRLDRLARDDLSNKATRQVTGAGTSLEAARGLLEAL